MVLQLLQLDIAYKRFVYEMKHFNENNYKISYFNQIIQKVYAKYIQKRIH